MRLEGKVAIISGGARGMGAAEARLFAREGAKVIIGDVLEEEGRQVEAEISESGGQGLEMRKVGGGSIINISSIWGIVGSPRSTSYHASKGAVRLLTKSTAIQYAREGIRANSVHPGPIATPMTEGLRVSPDRNQSWLTHTPLGRWGEPEEVAYGVLFLASDESSFMTGSELVIDGGWMAQ